MTWLALKLFAGNALKSAWGWLSHASLWQLATLALAVFAGVEHVQLVDARHDAAKWQQQDQGHVAALKVSQANETTLKAALNRQNAAVDALAKASKQQQAAAAKASQKAAERASEAEEAAQRLIASSRAGGASQGQCEPSKALQEQWQ